MALPKYVNVNKNRLLITNSILGLCAIISSSVVLADTEESKPSRPNIVVVLADDMGWGDCSTYGHKVIKSPNLDRLAAEGVKFSQCYSASGVCSPSRSAILTGRTPYRNGVWRHLSGLHKAHLRSSEITYPELLKDIGYETCHIGKWHLLSRQQFDNPKYPQIGEHGYDYWVATHNNASPSHENPDNFYKNGEKLGKLEGYSAPLVADEAIHWLKNVRDESKPFVLSVWFHEPHKPIATDIKFSSLYPEQNEKDSKYFGNITQLDYALGQLMKTLDDEKLSDNTILIFSSDNGPVATEGGSSGGLRGNKRSDFEGGIRVPGVVRWPGHIKAGSVSDVPVIGTDIFATVLDITGIPLPDDRTIDGVSMLPAFEGKPVVRKSPLFWRTHVSHKECRLALRVDDWKIVSNDKLTEFLLFNMKEDMKEEKNLISQETEKAEEMKRLLIDHWNSVSEDGPNEWWEGENKKPTKDGSLNY